MERFERRDLFNRIFADYQMFLFRDNYRKPYWENKPQGRIRRRFTRTFLQRRMLLCRFNPATMNGDILLVPKGKARFLPDQKVHE